MGINSTEVSYGFGQLGSAYSDISEESSVMKRGQMITQKNKLKNKLKQYKK